MRARFIGDPNDGRSGPAELSYLGSVFPKGKWVAVDGKAGAKLSVHSHFEVENDPLDHDDDGEKGGSLSKAEIVERLKALGVEFDGRSKRDDLAKLLEAAEDTAEQEPAGESDEQPE